MKRRVFLIGGTAILALALGVPASAEDGRSQPPDARPPAQSSARPNDAVPAGFSSWDELFTVQDKLNAAADKIVGMRGEGYAGIVAAPENRALQVYWKGTVPTSVRQLSDNAGVPVSFRSARFSAREMAAETQRLGADKRILSVGPKVDGSGLTVRLNAAGRAALRAGAFANSTMPWSVRSEGASVPTTRDNDWSPYVGGALYYNTSWGNSFCTTGFAIWWNNLDYMLTAGHCGDNGNIAMDFGGDPAVDTMGDLVADNNVRDTLIINTWSWGESYIGPYTSNSTADVIGAGIDYVGNYVCTGGGRTGEHCGIQVTNVDISEGGWYPLNRASYPATTTCAVARGDSGGPVYTYSGNALVGRGTISRSHIGTAICPNAPVADSGYDVYYAPLLRPAGGATIGSLQYYGASVL